MRQVSPAAGTSVGCAQRGRIQPSDWPRSGLTPWYSQTPRPEVPPPSTLSVEGAQTAAFWTDSEMTSLVLWGFQRVARHESVRRRSVPARWGRPRRECPADKTPLHYIAARTAVIDLPDHVSDQKRRRRFHSATVFIADLTGYGRSPHRKRPGEHPGA